jgi:hypothetical protein
MNKYIAMEVCLNTSTGWLKHNWDILQYLIIHRPTQHGLIKLHKQGHPIQPITNWTNAPAYKIAKLLTKKCALYFPLPYIFNIRNPTHLIADFIEIPVDQILILPRLI